MLTDAPPRQGNRTKFLESDRFRDLQLLAASIEDTLMRA